MRETIQWRTNNAYDSVLIVDDAGKVATVFISNMDAIRDMLVSLGDLEDWDGEDEGDAVRPEDYGDLVMTRAADGAVLEVNEKAFRDRLSYWFRGE